MPIIGNPWAQDAAAFGQQTGQALSQGLLQLPQQRYALALQGANLQRALQQMQMMNQYHQGLIGLREQGLEQQGQYRDMANQINMLRAQAEQDRINNAASYDRFRMNQPLVVPAGSSIYDRNALQGGQQDGSPQPLVAPTATAPQRPPAPITQNQLGDQFLKTTLPMLGMYGTNVVNANPGLWKSFTNFQATGRVPSGWGQQTTNSLQANPPNPQQLSASTNQVMTATNPTTGQRIRSVDGGNSWQPF